MSKGIGRREEYKGVVVTALCPKRQCVKGGGDGYLGRDQAPGDLTDCPMDFILHVKEIFSEFYTGELQGHSCF